MLKTNHNRINLRKTTTAVHDLECIEAPELKLKISKNTKQNIVHKFNKQQFLGPLNQ